MEEYECINLSLKNELAAANERNKLNLQELSEKEEELVVLRVELSSLQEKFAAKKEQVWSYTCITLAIHETTSISDCKKLNKCNSFTLCEITSISYDDGT